MCIGYINKEKYFDIYCAGQSHVLMYGVFMKKYSLLLLLIFFALPAWASAAQSAKDKGSNNQLALYSVAYEAIPSDDQLLSKVKAQATAQGYSFSKENKFVVGEIVLSKRSDGSLVVGKIENINNNGTYTVRVHEPKAGGKQGIKDSVNANLGKFPQSPKKIVIVDIPEKLYQFLEFSTLHSQNNQENMARLLSWLETNQNKNEQVQLVFKLPINLQQNIGIKQIDFLYKLIELNLKLSNETIYKVIESVFNNRNLSEKEVEKIFSKLIEKAFDQGFTYDQIIHQKDAEHQKRANVKIDPEFIEAKKEKILSDILDNAYSKQQKPYVNTVSEKHKSEEGHVIPSELFDIMMEPSDQRIHAFKEAIFSMPSYYPVYLHSTLGKAKKIALENIEQALSKKEKAETETKKIKYEYLTLQDSTGYTPLLYAVYMYRTDAVEHLIKLINENLKSVKDQENYKAETFGAKASGMNAYCLAKFKRSELAKKVEKDKKNNPNAIAFATLSYGDKSQKLYFEQIFPANDKETLKDYEHDQAVLAQYDKIIQLLEPHYENKTCPQ